MDRRRGGPGDAAVVQAVFDEAIALHRRVRDVVDAPIVLAADAMSAAFAAGGKVLAFGNGGSATDAQHLAAELVGRFERERPGLAAIALTTDGSVLTSIANDDSFGRIFARQVEALGRPGDVAVGISTSGHSANVLAGLEAARAGGLTTVALTGRDGGAIGRLAAIHIHVEDLSTARVQEVHRTVIHAICKLVERAIE
jgi:D-sedoheptulose 7-phosphate isomerase